MRVLKAVIDTNIMVSIAFSKKGLARTLKDMIADDCFIIATSVAILKEVYHVLHYPRILKRFSPSEAEINEFIELILEHAFITKGATSG